MNCSDEVQFTCKTENVAQLRTYLEKWLRVAGEHLEMECPLASDSICGSSWLFTH